MFRRGNPRDYLPVLREAVGWIDHEDDSCMRILWDRTVRKVPHERMNPSESGLVILRSDIQEIKELGPVA
jgi:hypothetical protein